MKRTVQEIRQDILKALSNGQEHSFGNLERKVNTNWQTIRNHCKELMFFKVVNIENNKVKLTKEGRRLIKNKS